jgi:hypothetical protein
MPDTPKPDDDKLPEAEAEARFNRLVGRLVNTPHTPHTPHKEPSHDRMVVAKVKHSRRGRDHK